MRSITERRFPIMLIILFALLGIAVSVAIGRVIAAQTGQTTTRSSMEEDRWRGAVWIQTIPLRAAGTLNVRWRTDGVIRLGHHHRR